MGWQFRQEMALWMTIQHVLPVIWAGRACNRLPTRPDASLKMLPRPCISAGLLPEGEPFLIRA
jgi:hypothetical protein